MGLDDFTLIGPVAYGGKEGCTNGRCRSMPDGAGGWICVGWHCSYCDEPTSYQGHNCDAAEAILGEAKRIVAEGVG
jgi:hypothetical protein